MEVFYSLQTMKNRSILNRLSYTHIVVIGFLLLIVIGTVLLKLPIASKGAPLSFTDTFFTATSATCVTGLVQADTATQWTLFGQIVILVLIQVGGLGFMTVITLFSFMLGRRIGLHSRELLMESVNVSSLGGVVALIKKVIIGTAVVEGAGAVALSIRFVPMFGAAKGIYYGIFHSISAFCNAGFDLMGETEAYSSFVYLAQDKTIMLTLTILIVVSGIGFLVWDDVTRNGLHFSAYTLHSKIAITTTLVLIIGGTLLFLVSENGNTLAGLSPGNKVVVSLFSAVTPRTAGFNCVDTAAMTPASTMMTVVFMIIGGSPGSTAGGIKTTTIAVMAIVALASFKKSQGYNTYGRRLEESVIQRAVTVVAVYALLFVCAVTVIGIADAFLPLKDVVFEVASACSTVGMTTGITRSLSDISRWVVILCMFLGRVGSVTFFMALTAKKNTAKVTLPKEDINIG